MRTGKKDDFPSVRGCFGHLEGVLGTASEKCAEGAMAFMADLMGPIYQISPGTFFGSLESFSQLASIGAQTTQTKLTPFPCPHGEGEGVILYEIS